MACVRSRLLMSPSSQGHADKEPGRDSGSGERSTWSRGGFRVWKPRSVTVRSISVALFKWINLL